MYHDHIENRVWTEADLGALLSADDRANAASRLEQYQAVLNSTAIRMSLLRRELARTELPPIRRDQLFRELASEEQIFNHGGRLATALRNVVDRMA